MHDNICQDMELLKDIVMDELNVKTVEIRSNEEEVVHLSAKANFKSLGSKLGKNMKAAAAKIMELSFVDIQRLRAGESISMSLDGIDPFDLALEDILIQREEKEGMAVANEGDITVALDLHLDADLKREGLAREMVHVIQNLRKENGFDVSDRITITYSGSDEVAGAVGQFQEYIQGETLCTSLERVDAVDGNAVDLEGHSVVFDVEKVA